MMELQSMTTATAVVRCLKHEAQMKNIFLKVPHLQSHTSKNLKLEHLSTKGYIKHEDHW